MLQPKHIRPGKRGFIWPGVHKIPLSYRDQSKPWKFNCPAPMCFYLGAYESEAAARRIQETHPCPWFGGGTTTISWGIMSRMFVEPLWAELDNLVYIIKDDNQDPDERGKAAQQARGLAFALAHLMPPFFSTVEEISHEALVRWEKKNREEDYETPGLGRLRYAVPGEAEVYTTSGLRHEMVAGTKHAPEYHPSKASRNRGLTDKKIAEILEASAKGFPPKMLATVHGVTVDVITAVIRDHGQAG